MNMNWVVMDVLGNKYPFLMEKIQKLPLARRRRQPKKERRQMLAREIAKGALSHRPSTPREIYIKNLNSVKDDKQVHLDAEVAPWWWENVVVQCRSDVRERVDAWGQRLNQPCEGRHGTGS